MTSDRSTATLPPGYLLRRMRPADTPRTAKLHRQLLPNGLFPRLGPRYLRRWHCTFLDTPAATGLAVVHQGEVVAFVLATLDQRLYLHHTLRNHRFSLMWRGALGLLSRPHVLVHFIRTRARSYARHLLPNSTTRQSNADSEEAPDTPEAFTDPEGRRIRVAVIHAVITTEQARGKGCARALLDSVASSARTGRADHIALVTDVPDPLTAQPPAGAAAMYESLGWDRVDVRRHRDGRWIAEYRLCLHTTASPEAVGPSAASDRKA